MVAVLGSFMCVAHLTISIVLFYCPHFTGDKTGLERLHNLPTVISKTETSRNSKDFEIQIRVGFQRPILCPLHHTKSFREAASKSPGSLGGGMKGMVMCRGQNSEPVANVTASKITHQSQGLPRASQAPSLSDLTTNP